MRPIVTFFSDERLAALASPWNRITTNNLVPSDNAAVTPVCTMGAMPPAPESDSRFAVPREPQAVNFTVRLVCPPIVMRLARLRRASSYFNTSSVRRRSIREFLSVWPNPRNIPRGNMTPAQLAWYQADLLGDVLERTNVFSELMLERGSTVFSHDAAAYYAKCAPSSCSFTKIEPRTTGAFLLDATIILGGTASTVIGVIGWIVLYISFAGHAGASFCGAGRRWPPKVPTGPDLAAQSPLAALARVAEWARPAAPADRAGEAAPPLAAQEKPLAVRV